MTKPISEYIQRLRSTREKATPGEWELTFENPEGFPCVYLDAQKTKDLLISDMNLIDLAANEMNKVCELLEVMSEALGSVDQKLTDLSKVLRQSGKTEEQAIAEHDACLIAIGFLNTKKTLERCEQIIKGKGK